MLTKQQKHSFKIFFLYFSIVIVALILEIGFLSFSFNVHGDIYLKPTHTHPEIFGEKLQTFESGDQLSERALKRMRIWIRRVEDLFR